MQAVLLLLVEDDVLIADVMADALADDGYEVIAARDGNEALEILRQRGEALKALVTDVDLGPGPRGWDIARAARQIRPGMAVVFATSVSANDWAAEGVPNSILVAKPFAAGQLVTAVASLLNQSSTAPATLQAAPDED